MKKETKEKHFIKQPIYPGGAQKMNAFISGQLRIPKEIEGKNIDGTVIIRYAIDHHGKVTQTKVISPLHPACDREAERVIRLLEFQVPKQYKARVLFHKTTQIRFKSSPAPSPTTIYYNYVTSSTPSNTEEPQTSIDYNYTIRITQS